jgi:hypothetical protein
MKDANGRQVVLLQAAFPLPLFGGQTFAWAFLIFLLMARLNYLLAKLQDNFRKNDYPDEATSKHFEPHGHIET